MPKTRKPKLTDAERFFYEHAGHSYDPRMETSEEGRVRCAKELAKAESWLTEQPGFQVEWVQDRYYDPKDYDVPGMPDIGWGCVVKIGEKRESLWGITFDGDGYPDGNSYARVVVAELASELMG